MICGPATPRGDALLAAHNATCRSLWSNGSDGPVQGETSCRLQTDAGVEMDGVWHRQIRACSTHRLAGREPRPFQAF